MQKEQRRGNTDLDDLILRTCDLPVLPATAQKLLAMMSDPDISVEGLKDVIMADPGITAKILKIANSAFYGGHRSIQNLSQAIMRLGFRAVENIVMAASMKGVYKRFGLTEKLLWEQSIGSAVISHIITRRSSPAYAEDAFIGGLLHDVGKVVLNNEDPDSFHVVMERVYNEGCSFREVEDEIFGFNHMQVGALVVRKWSFPESMEMLIKYFDNIESLSTDEYLYSIAKSVVTSDRICQKLGIGWRCPVEGVMDDDELRELLDMDAEEVTGLVDNVKSGVA